MNDEETPIDEVIYLYRSLSSDQDRQKCLRMFEILLEERPIKPRAEWIIY